VIGCSWCRGAARVLCMTGDSTAVGMTTASGAGRTGRPIQGTRPLRHSCDPVCSGTSDWVPCAKSQQQQGLGNVFNSTTVMCEMVENLRPSDSLESAFRVLRGRAWLRRSPGDFGGAFLAALYSFETLVCCSGLQPCCGPMLVSPGTHIWGTRTIRR